MWLEACPDASVTYTRTDSGAYVVALQRRLGLYMSTARSVNDGVLDAGGGSPTIPRRRRVQRWRALANRAWRAALAAVAVGEVILGDKKRRPVSTRSITKAMCA